MLLLDYNIPVNKPFIPRFAIVVNPNHPFANTLTSDWIDQ